MFFCSNCYRSNVSSISYSFRGNIGFRTLALNVVVLILFFVSQHTLTSLTKKNMPKKSMKKKGSWWSWRSSTAHAHSSAMNSTSLVDQENFLSEPSNIYNSDVAGVSHKEVGLHFGSFSCFFKMYVFYHIISTLRNVVCHKPYVWKSQLTHYRQFCSYF